MGPPASAWSGIGLVPADEHGYWVRPEPDTFGEHLRLPRSTAYDGMAVGTPVVIARSFVACDGPPVARLAGGRFDARDVDGQVVLGLLEPLRSHAARQQREAAVRGEEWARNLVVFADADTRFDTLVAVLATAGRAGYGHYQFAIDVGTSGLPVGVVLDVSPPNIAETEAGEAAVIDPPSMRVFVRNDDLLVQIEGREPVVLPFGPDDTIPSVELTEIARREAGRLEGSVKYYPTVVVSAEPSVPFRRIVAALSAVSGPECGADAKLAQDHARCLFPFRVIEAGQVGQGTAAAADATVRGALDKDAIRRVVRARIVDVRACYNRGLVDDPTLQGRVVVDFVIGPDGTVASAVATDRTDLAHADVTACIVAAVRRWTFPKPSRGGNVVVAYPFVLVPG